MVPVFPAGQSLIITGYSSTWSWTPCSASSKMMIAPIPGLGTSEQSTVVWKPAPLSGQRDRNLVFGDDQNVGVKQDEGQVRFIEANLLMLTQGRGRSRPTTALRQERPKSGRV